MHTYTLSGLEDLDNLAELDLTDNLLGKHSCLRPFLNLHHLSMVSPFLTMIIMALPYVSVPVEL